MARPGLRARGTDPVGGHGLRRRAAPGEGAKNGRGQAWLPRVGAGAVDREGREWRRGLLGAGTS